MRNPYQSGCVLQQDTLAAVKGYADPGAKVTLKPSWGKAKYTATADAEGLWTAYVRTPKASYTNYSISVKSGKESILLEDVLIGEVWIAGGQSNMEMPLAGWGVVYDVMDVIMAPSAPDKVRIFMGDRTMKHEPQTYTDGWWFRSTAAERAPMSATAYFFATKLNEVLDVPVGMVVECVGGTRVEGWLPKDICAEYGEPTDPEVVDAIHFMGRPYVFFNGMINPVAGYTARGFIWYQGCSNVGYPAGQYVDHFGRMARVWRDLWNDAQNRMPFYFVQIAPFEYGNWQYEKAPALRADQWRAGKEIPNCGCICTNDLVGEECRHDIHPRNKKAFGDRLAMMALNRNYGFKWLPADAAEAVGMRRADWPHEVIVEISNNDGGLDNVWDIQGLEIAGEDGVFYPVKAGDFRDDGLLHLWSEEVEHPVTLRYCWHDFAPGNLRTRIGRPVAPFCISIK